MTTLAADQQRFEVPATPDSHLPQNMVRIPGGAFLMGSDNHYPEEAPAHRVTVAGFWMDRHTATNLEFKRFVDATGYITLAERPANPADYPGAKPELLVPSSVMFRKATKAVDMRDHYNWWTYVAGANWRHPRGPASSLQGLWKHPVVHVAFEDAQSYATWARKELPTEAEWEFAARGGLDGEEFCWGDEFMPNGRHLANTWQGEFPWQNLLADGYEWTAPVGSFPANGYGLHDMAGNVWEWTIDWYRNHSRIGNAPVNDQIDEKIDDTAGQPCCATQNPRKEDAADSFDLRTPGVRIPRKVMKGGSYLCSPSYCRRYRPAARMAQPIDTSTCHLGFRCIVRDSA